METEPKPPPNASCDSPASDKRNWLIQNVLLPLENSCRQNYTERQIDFWVDWFISNHWIRAEILTALQFLMGECKFLPSAADWVRVRPRPEGPPMPPVGESVPETTARLAATAPTSWAQFTLAEMTTGLKTCDMAAAYDKIIAEGKRRGIDPHEIQQFKQARLDMITMRGAKAKQYAQLTSKKSR